MKTARSKLLHYSVTFLLFAVMVAACSKKSDPLPVVVKTDLEAAIVAANLLLTTTFEGVAAGNYIKGSKAPLTAAVATATTIAGITEVTQATVTNATVALNAAIATYQAQIVVPIDPTNLVGQWTFDQIASATVGAVVKDYSGNARDGTMKAGHVFWGAGTNIPTLTSDRYGVANKALHFDKGSNVEIPYNTALNPPVISISVWTKSDINDPILNNQYFIAMNRWNGYKFNYQDSPKAFFTATYDDPAIPVVKQCCYDRDNASPLVNQGIWWHVVVTFGGGNTIFYLNGVMVKTWNNTPGTVSSLSATPVALVFGQDLPTSVYVTTPNSSPFFVDYGGYFKGSMDEVRIYKSILSAAQVTSIYNAEKP